MAPHLTAVFGIVCKLHISSQFEYTTVLLHRGENMPWGAWGGNANC